MFGHTYDRGAIGYEEYGEVTYNDDAANNHQIPYQVLLSWELGVPYLELTQVRKDEVGIKQHVEVGPGYHEARDEPVERGRELEEQRVVEEEREGRDHARVDADGACEHSRCDRPVKTLLA